MSSKPEEPRVYIRCVPSTGIFRYSVWSGPNYGGRLHNVYMTLWGAKRAANRLLKQLRYNPNPNIIWDSYEHSSQ